MALALGAAQAWVTRFTMNPDGVPYLDIGDAYWRGDWHNAINAYWSPLYSLILGFFLKLFKPPAYWEYPTVHLVNFLIYVAALGCFEFFLVTFITLQKERDQHLSAGREIGIPEWAWWVLGYSLFLSSAIILIGLRLVTPDLCVAGFVYLASALILKIKRGRATRRTFLVLGVVLGLAYLAKAVMFPLGFVFLLTAGLAGGMSRNSLRSVVLTTLAFLSIASPFVAAISFSKGRPTFGDSGRLTYAGCVNGVDPWYPGDGGRLTCLGTGSVEGIDEPSPASQSLRHPTARIFDFPAAYSFAEPVAGTYPFWYDISYWQEGIKGHFDARIQTQTTALSWLVYAYLLLTAHLSIFTSFLALLLVSQGRPQLLGGGLHWELVVPAAAAFILYSLVHAEVRYVAGFAPILWFALFSMLRFRDSTIPRLFARSAAGVILITTLWLIAMTISHDPAPATQNAPMYGQAAAALHDFGVRPGERIAVVSREPFGEGGAFVARLAALQIIAQVNQPDRFWSSPPSTQLAVLEAFRRAGCEGVLAWKVPISASGWHRLGETGYYFVKLEDRPKQP